MFFPYLSLKKPFDFTVLLSWQTLLGFVFLVSQASHHVRQLPECSENGPPHRA